MALNGSTLLGHCHRHPATEQCKKYSFYGLMGLLKHFISLTELGLCCGTRGLWFALRDAWPGTKPRSPALGAQSLSHWTSRQVARTFLSSPIEVLSLFNTDSQISPPPTPRTQHSSFCLSMIFACYRDLLYMESFSASLFMSGLFYWAQCPPDSSMLWCVSECPFS